MEYKELSLDEIKRPRHIIRSGMDQEKLLDLRDSIARFGILEPVAVRRIGQSYELIAGDRRCMAAEMAGLAKVPAVILQANEAEADLLKYEENFQREDVDPIAEGAWFAFLHQQHALSYDEVAKRVGRSKAYILQRVQLLVQDRQVREAVEQGQINFSVARELNACKDISARRRFLEAAVKSGAKALIVRQWRVDSEGDRAPAPLDDDPRQRSGTARVTAASASDQTNELAPVSSADPEYVPTETECYTCRLPRENSQLEYKPVCRSCRERIEDALAET